MSENPLLYTNSLDHEIIQREAAKSSPLMSDHISKVISKKKIFIHDSFAPQSGLEEEEKEFCSSRNNSFECLSNPD
jgi:hypothetical protein